MNEHMSEKFNSEGLTVVELIMTIAILGILIAPLTSMFITSAKINKESSKQFKSAQLAQIYMEEIKAMDELDTSIYIYNNEAESYKRLVNEVDNNYGAVITINPDGIIYYIIVDIISEGEVITSLEGSKIFK